MPGLPVQQPRRITSHPVLGEVTEGEWIQITVDGNPIQARAGEPIAAALIANGIFLCRTMPGSGSQRGLFCGVGRCPDCMMIVDGQPNVRTCITPVREGMQIETQRGW